MATATDEDEEEGTETSGRKKKTPKTLAEIRDEFRKGDNPVVIYETDSDKTPIYQTRFPLLNVQLGGGVRGGAIIELFGPEDSGKSTSSIAIAADIQKKAPEGKNHVLLTNFEGPEPWDWWRQIGLNTDPKYFTQMRPRSLEEGIGKGARLVETGEVCCWITDSVYAAEAKESRRQVTEQWAKGEGKGAGMGVEARQWGKAWTSVKGILQDHNCVAIAVNQIRVIINQGGGPKRPGWMPPPTTTPRGGALKFYAWVRLEVRGMSLNQDETMKKRYEGKDGRVVRMRVIKNKTSNVARGMVEYALIRGEGFDLTSDMIDLALQAGIIKAGGGGNFTIGDRKLRGREALEKLIKSSDRLQAALGAKVQTYVQSKIAKDEPENLEQSGEDDAEEEASE